MVVSFFLKVGNIKCQNSTCKRGLGKPKPQRKKEDSRCLHVFSAEIGKLEKVKVTVLARS